jgi:UDP-N-acetylglucosamine--N-acetylmuramyl-(pentapeptide) pyrophosphoryl-undecaprenol N-acetylglucosamine transferase
MISGGATGGHLMPALAVARAFRAEDPTGAILVVGKAGGPEVTLVPEAGFELATVTMQGLDRDAPLKNLALPFLVPAALAQGISLVRRFRPDVVLGVGGYAMAPAVAAARLLGIRYVLAVFEAGGLANRLFRSGAAAACVSFPGDVERFVTRRTVFTGYPLRPGFVTRVPAVPPRHLLVMGGSQGARNINEAVWEALDGLLQRFEQVTHLTGAQGKARGGDLVRPGYAPIAFTSDVPALMAQADLVVCRGGVGTLAEVTAVGLPAVVIPGRFGGGHQEHNAAELASAGAALRLADQGLSGPALLAALDSLDGPRLTAMAAASRSLGRPDAARLIVQVLAEAAA